MLNLKIQKELEARRLPRFFERSISSHRSNVPLMQEIRNQWDTVIAPIVLVRKYSLNLMYVNICD